VTAQVAFDQMIQAVENAFSSDIPVVVVSEPEAASVSAPDSTPPAEPSQTPKIEPEAEPRLTRLKALAAVKAEIDAFADRVILARRLTLGTANVRSQALCSSGTTAFMTRGHLIPTKKDDVLSWHPVRETPEEAAAAETKIRAWCAKSVDGALEDFTATGLMKRAEKVRKEQEKWAKEFRELTVNNYKANYIRLERMQEVLPLLGMEQYEPQVHMQLSLNLNMDYYLPQGALNGLTPEVYAANERARLQEHMRAFAGERATWDNVQHPLNNARYLNVVGRISDRN
jgi:hypothetical protein